MGVSRSTVYRTLDKNNLQRERFSSISDEELNRVIREIKEVHPDVGEVMMMGHLRSRNICVQRSRMRNILHSVDRVGITQRQVTAINRREYYVPSPKYMWHLDGNHKLIRWKLVIHGCVDGYSRMIPFMRCSPNNKAITMVTLFNEATERIGWPLHIRTDHGGENVMVWNSYLCNCSLGMFQNADS
jgi:hypothetical protein